MMRARKVEAMKKELESRMPGTSSVAIQVATISANHCR